MSVPGSGQSAPSWGQVDTPGPVSNPWAALWAMLVGFFMILVDSTIVAVANPSIMEKLQTDYNMVIWVTSAYLLAYAVPLLVAGRLGDRYGTKNLYLIGLAVFTAASLWCGVSGSVEMLIVARLVQGVGAALLTPQTLSMITRMFPPERRGAAMGVWGATAGVATLVGPLAGGVLVDHLGWQWIFFVNVPVGVIGLLLAVRLIPVLPTHRHRFDVLGVALSGIAMFLVVFGLQEGETHHWAWWIWVMIAAGVAVMAVFVFWQSVNKDEPLIPLEMFADRNFTLSNVGVAVIGFAVTAMVVPAMFYAQAVCGLTPTESALLTAPMALATGVLAPGVGKIVDRVHPRPIVGFGFSVLAIALIWLSWEMTPDTPIWRLLLPFALIGVGMAFIWSPLAATATRNLAPRLAGAGSGVYNATRQLGSVLGSAAIAAFMSSWINAEIPGGAQMRPTGETALQMPPFLREPFSVAMSQSMLLPAFVSLFGVVAALFLVDAFVSVGGNAGHRQPDTPPMAPDRADEQPASATGPAPVAADTEINGPFRRAYPAVLAHDISYPEGFVDDDDAHVEFSVGRPDHFTSEQDSSPADSGDDSVASPDPEPLVTATAHLQQAPGGTRHSASVDPGRGPFAGGRAEPPDPEPIGFAHNGFHVDLNHRFRELPPPYAFDRLDDPAANLTGRIDDATVSVSDCVEHQPYWLFFDEGRSTQLPTGEHSEENAVSHRLFDEGGRHHRREPGGAGGGGRHALPGPD